MEEQKPEVRSSDIQTANSKPEVENSELRTQGSELLKSSNLDLSKLEKGMEAARSEIKKYLIGQEEVIELLLTGILSNGHILLEGVPGIAKTLIAKIIAKTLSVEFSRIQFTPDLMPSDIIGTSIFNMKTSDFVFKKGPIFSNIVLIDEINRAPAKTQAALFEVMEERQITFDGTTYQLDFPFLTIATQNPIEQEGTYRLPEAQLDRFLFKVKIGYPSVDEEKEILLRYKNEIKSPDLSEIKAVIKPEAIKEFQKIIEKVKVEDQLINYVAELINQTRSHGKLFLGASPRASLAILRTAKTIAAMRGRDFVIPDDIQYVAYPVLNHRIILSPEAEMEGLEPENIIQEIIQKVEVPR
ncbi:MAG: magnesium chelatase [Flavobacteriales bacterium]|nr:MAG: magnesium chelatase [Flavobacteriales bacterium]